MEEVLSVNVDIYKANVRVQRVKKNVDGDDQCILSAYVERSQWILIHAQLLC